MPLNKEKRNITLIVQACLRGNEDAQKALYRLFYSYAMSIALRYCANRSEAEEVLNESFFKALVNLDRYDPTYDFKQWLRSILIRTAIDYQRKYHKIKLDPTPVEEVGFFNAESNMGLDNLLFEDLLEEIQLLPPAYRLVFNLRAIDEYKHHEIAEQLSISVGTVRSNYARARKLLQEQLRTKYPDWSRDQKFGNGS